MYIKLPWAEQEEKLPADKSSDTGHSGHITWIFLSCVKGAERNKSFIHSQQHFIYCSLSFDISLSLSVQIKKKESDWHLPVMGKNASINFESQISTYLWNYLKNIHSTKIRERKPTTKYLTRVILRQAGEEDFECQGSCSPLFRRSSILLLLLCGVRKTRISDCVSPTLTFYNFISLLEHPAGLVTIQKCSSISAPS